MFDMKQEPWYIRVNNESEFNGAQQWLTENFGTNLKTTYNLGVGYLTNAAYGGYIEDDHVMYGNIESVNLTFRHKIKLTFKTIVDSVEYPETQTPAQIELKALQQKIKDLETQANKLQELINK